MEFLRCGKGVGWSVAALLASQGVAEAQVAPLQVADNGAVLAQWAQSTGAPAPEVVKQEDGGSQLEWHGGVTWDKYVNNSSGGNTLTPQRSGSMSLLQLTSDLRRIGPGADLAWSQFAWSLTDDRARQARASLIGTLQFGRSGEGYSLSLGDVPVSYSQLGANAAMRGVAAQKSLGNMVLSASAGVVGESWETLNNKDLRRQYLRNVSGLKIETPLGDATRIFFTVQGYSDEAGSLPPGATALSPSKGNSTTVGLNWAQGRFTVQGEAGFSHWEEQAQPGRNDRAFIVDGGWQGDSVGIRAGHHDIGLHYASLSGAAGTGVKESYVNGHWAAAQWVTMTGDLRHSENKMVAVQIPQTIPPVVPPVPPTLVYNPTTTDSANVGASFQFADLPAWQLQLNQSVSQGKNSTGNANRNEASSLNLRYTPGTWQAGVGYQLGKFSNTDATSGNGSTDTWSYFASKTWSDAHEAVATWNLTAALVINSQEQRLDSGSSVTSKSYTFSLDGQKLDLGVLNARLFYGDIGGAVPGAGGARQRGWEIGANHAFSKRSQVRFYWRDNRYDQAQNSVTYAEKTVGLQLIYAQ